MVEAANELIESEKSWLLHHLGLIPDHDDDVMGECHALSTMRSF